MASSNIDIDAVKKAFLKVSRGEVKTEVLERVVKLCNYTWVLNSILLNFFWNIVARSVNTSEGLKVRQTLTLYL